MDPSLPEDTHACAPLCCLSFHAAAGAACCPQGPKHSFIHMRSPSWKYGALDMHTLLLHCWCLALPLPSHPAGGEPLPSTGCLYRGSAAWALPRTDAEDCGADRKEAEVLLRLRDQPSAPTLNPKP